MNLTAESVATVLMDSKITSGLEPEYAAELLSSCRAGMINGRFLPSNSDMPVPPEDEFIFAEFIEAIARTAFRAEGSLEVAVHSRCVESAMLENFKAVAGLLIQKREEQAPPTRGGGRK